MKRILSFTLLCLLCLPIHAGVVAGLYSALVPVADYSDTERNRALQAGLLEVLVKLSGDRDIDQHKAVATLLAEYRRYVVEFGYKNISHAEVGQGLNIRYARNELDRFLRKNQLSIWPDNRPSLLLWMVSESVDGTQKFVSRDEHPELYASLDKVFHDRGQPILYPLLDLSDQISLHVSDAWELNVDQLEMASERYKADTWLLVRSYQTSGLDWKNAWVRSEKGQFYFDDFNSADLIGGMTAIAHQTIDKLVSDHSYVASLKKDHLPLTVTGIQSFSRYSELVTLMAGLSMVQSVRLQGIRGDTVSMQLVIDGDVGQLLDSLRLSKKLQVPEQPVAQGEALVLPWVARW